jgi:phage recombination protein Bet
MTMNQVANKQPADELSVTGDLATFYGMNKLAFEATLRATVFPSNGSREHLAAFLVVAKQYGLNPITKEIYAFPAKGGGIQPIVSIDGWMNLMNSHPAMDGLEFEDIFDGKELLAIKCRVYRKDRSRPIEVVEYMTECKRKSEPWEKWPARMLRHKAAIQAARYAFGFAGIIDPDEWDRSPENPNSGHQSALVAPVPPTPPRPALAHPAAEQEVIETVEAVEVVTLAQAEEAFKTAQSMEDLETLFGEFIPQFSEKADLDELYRLMKVEENRLELEAA